MKYTFKNESGNARTVNIPEDFIQRTKKSLGCTTKEAIDIYLSDEGYITNEVVQELTEKAKGQVHRETSGKKRTVTRKPDLVKQELIKVLRASLEDAGMSIVDVEVMNIERMIRFKINDDIYEVTLSKKRKPKN